MEPVSESEISAVYEERRLAGLRQVAREINAFVETEVIPRYTSPPSNSIITAIDERDADYLYFAIYNRMDFFRRIHSRIKIPEYVKYGEPYDTIFQKFTRYRLMKEFPENWLPYLMMRYPDKLPFVYMNLFLYSGQATIISTLNNLMRGTSRDRILTNLLESYQAAIQKDEQTQFSTNSEPSVRNIVIRRLISMMQSGEFDVLDSIYIILNNDSYQEPASNLLMAFKNLADA